MNSKKTAFLSAHDKGTLEDFARGLVALGWDLLATKGTCRFLQEKGIPVRFPTELFKEPILGHHSDNVSEEMQAALQARDTPEDNAKLEKLGIPRIDLVYVDPRPIRNEISRFGHTLESVAEHTDLGGLYILRLAVKGRLITLCHQRQLVPALLMIENPPSERERFEILEQMFCQAELLAGDSCNAAGEFHRRARIQSQTATVPAHG